MNTTVFKPLPELPESFLKGRACSTAHFYDGLTLMTKHWSWMNADALGILRGKYWSIVQGVRIGEPAIRKCMQDQLGVLKQDTKESLGSYPTLIGEIGCPYDMDGRKAYGFADGGKGKGDYSAQQRAWDCSVNANDGRNVLNYTLWTYAPNNSHLWGDNWNGEDLSLWSSDDLQQSNSLPYQGPVPTSKSELLATPSLASSQTLAPTWSLSPKGIASGEEVTPRLLLDGARAVAAICRPFPVATVGTPERIDFDIKSSTFRLAVRVTPQSSGEVTEIYVPFVHYAADLTWGEAPLSRDSSKSSLSDGNEDLLDIPKLSKSVAGSKLQLDLAVKVTAGTYTVEGQYLYWKYPIPRRETTYHIEIKRKGGPLALHQLESEPSWADALANYIGCTIC